MNEKPNAPADTQTTRALNRLIQACKDGEKGYGDAAADVRDPTLKSLFENYSDQRALVAGALQAAVTTHGGEAGNTGSLGGAFHRGWFDVLAALRGLDTLQVLEEREHGEDMTRATYEAALREGLPPRVESVLREQLVAIKTAHAEMLRLKTPAPS